MFFNYSEDDYIVVAQDTQQGAFLAAGFPRRNIHVTLVNRIYLIILSACLRPLRHKSLPH